MSYKRSSLMQERMEQNRKSILSSARKLISKEGLKTHKFKRLRSKQAFRVDWFIATLTIRVRC